MEKRELEHRIGSLNRRVQSLNEMLAGWEKRGLSLETPLAKKIKAELAEITPSTQITGRLGWLFYFGYKEKHPTISAETRVEDVPLDYARYGFELAIPQKVQLFVGKEVPKASTYYPRITIKPEQFEKWRYVREFIVAFVPETNTIYSAILV